MTQRELESESSKQKLAAKEKSLRDWRGRSGSRHSEEEIQESLRWFEKNLQRAESKAKSDRKRLADPSVRERLYKSQRERYNAIKEGRWNPSAEELERANKDFEDFGWSIRLKPTITAENYQQSKRTSSRKAAEVYRGDRRKEDPETGKALESWEEAKARGRANKEKRKLWKRQHDQRIREGKFQRKENPNLQWTDNTSEKRLKERAEGSVKVRQPKSFWEQEAEEALEAIAEGIIEALIPVIEQVVINWWRKRRVGRANRGKNP